MIGRIEFQNASNQVFALELEDYDSPYTLEDFTNLDPVKMELVSTSVATADGDIFQSGRRGRRSSVLTIGMERTSTKTIRDLRSTLAQFFMPGSELTIVFHDDEFEPLKLNGKVEDFNASPFQAEPKAEVSITCFDPAFYATREDFLDFYVPPAGVISKELPYNGTLENGLSFTYQFGNSEGAPGGIQVFLTRADGSTQSMDIGYAFLKDDILGIETVDGKKEVTVTRDSQKDSILYALSYQSDWLNLMPGGNTLRILANQMATDSSYVLVSWWDKHGGL